MLAVMFLLLFVPYLSLAIMLSALFMMAPQHKFFWLWRTACLVAAVPPLLLIVMFLLLPSEGLSWTFTFLSAVASAPIAAALSLAVAVRLRSAA
jgi:hypothetical protein